MSRCWQERNRTRIPGRIHRRRGVGTIRPGSRRKLSTRGKRTGGRNRHVAHLSSLVFLVDLALSKRIRIWLLCARPLRQSVSQLAGQAEADESVSPAPPFRDTGERASTYPGQGVKTSTPSRVLSNAPRLKLNGVYWTSLHRFTISA